MILKLTEFLPTLNCLKKTGPLDVILISRATIKIIGLRINIPNNEVIMSNNRLIIIPENLF